MDSELRARPRTPRSPVGAPGPRPPEPDRPGRSSAEHRVRPGFPGRKTCAAPPRRARVPAPAPRGPAGRGLLLFCAPPPGGSSIQAPQAYLAAASRPAHPMKRVHYAAHVDRARGRHLDLAILSGVLVPRVTNHLKSARDARRCPTSRPCAAPSSSSNMDKGSYPTPNANSSYGGWDVSERRRLHPRPARPGLPRRGRRRPINDATFQLPLLRLRQGLLRLRGQLGLLRARIRNFESADFAAKNKGFFACSGRNWNDEFAYVTGGGANKQ